MATVREEALGSGERYWMAECENARIKIIKLSKELKLVTKERNRCRLRVEQLQEGKMLSDYIRALDDMVEFVIEQYSDQFIHDKTTLCLLILNHLKNLKREERRKLRKKEREKFVESGDRSSAGKEA